MPLKIAIDDIDPLGKVLKTSALGQTLSEYNIPDYTIKHAEDSDRTYTSSIRQLKDIVNQDNISFDRCRHSLGVVLRHCRSGLLAEVVKAQISFILKNDPLKKNTAPLKIGNNVLKSVVQNIVTAYKNSTSIYSISGDNTDLILEINGVPKISQIKQEYNKKIQEYTESRKEKEREGHKEESTKCIDNTTHKSSRVKQPSPTKIPGMLNSVKPSIRIVRSQLPKGVGDLVKINKELSSDYVCNYKNINNLRIVSMYEQIETKASIIVASKQAKDEVRKLKDVVDILINNNDELKKLNSIDKFAGSIDCKIGNTNWLKLVTKYLYTYEIICIYNICVLKGVTSSPSKQRRKIRQDTKEKINKEKTENTENTKLDKVLSIDDSLEDLIDGNNLELLSYADWKKVSIMYKEVRDLWRLGGMRVKFDTLPKLVWKLFANEAEYKKFKKNYMQIYR